MKSIIFAIVVLVVWWLFATIGIASGDIVPPQGRTHAAQEFAGVMFCACVVGAIIVKRLFF